LDEGHHRREASVSTRPATAPLSPSSKRSTADLAFAYRCRGRLSTGPRAPVAV
jgi:hypothetical protein